MRIDTSQDSRTWPRFEPGTSRTWSQELSTAWRRMANCHHRSVELKFALYWRTQKDLRGSLCEMPLKRELIQSIIVGRKLTSKKVALGPLLSQKKSREQYFTKPSAVERPASRIRIRILQTCCYKGHADLIFKLNVNRHSENSLVH